MAISCLLLVFGSMGDITYLSDFQYAVVNMGYLLTSC